MGCHGRPNLSREDDMSELNTKALTTMIDLLEPLTSEERHRMVKAAMTFLGETTKTASDSKSEAKDGTGAGDEGYSETAGKWMTQNGVSADQLDRVFHFRGDGTFDIHDVPGATKKEKTLNTYILTGVGRYLATAERQFDDFMTREACKRIGCYDEANHSAIIKGNKGGEFSGDKKTGYAVTNIGLRRGAELVKELAGAAT
jgi:hypothetical protein